MTGGTFKFCFKYFNKQATTFIMTLHVCVNFPNGDMVGHTGDIDATIIACKSADKVVKVGTKLLFFLLAHVIVFVLGYRLEFMFPNEHLVHTELHVLLILVIMPGFVHVSFLIAREVINFYIHGLCVDTHVHACIHIYAITLHTCICMITCLSAVKHAFVGMPFGPIAPKLHECKFQSL